MKQLFLACLLLLLHTLTTTIQAQEVDGVTACSGCTGSNLQCVGRTILDSNCHACATGQQFWPCNLKQECWCWDTTLPRDPGDGEDKTACSGCGVESDTETCVGNQNSLTPVSDEECTNCMYGQSYWPCSDQDLCWCWDTTKPKKPPAPISGYPVNDGVDACELFTEDMFNVFAPNATFPYTYEGLCEAIRDYNKDHTEKVFQMGTEEMIRMEIAAFLGNTAHESDELKAGREYLACGDRKVVDGKVYCKPCTNDLYDWSNHECSVSMVVQNAPYNSYCQPGFEPPEGCVCGTITQVEESGPLAGYVEASKVFYGRGAIQLSWNYNYIRASFALTGEAETFCNDPEQVATNPMYAWGTAIFFWMESIKEGTTCHKEALNRDFGGTLNVINGGLECPAYKGGWHHDAIKMRINRYCHAAVLLGLEKLSSFNGCSGLTESFEECLGDGWCPKCSQYSNVPTEESGFSAVDIADVESTEEDSGLEQQQEEEFNNPKPSKPVIDDVDTNIYTDIAGETDNVPIVTENDAVTPTYSPTLKQTPPPIATESPTDAFIITKNPTKEVTKAPFTPPIVDTNTPSLKPTSLPTISPSTTSPTEVPTFQQPTYMPTTPAPTMGPCDGLPCIGGRCRSAWGFCGDGEGYCNDSSIWNPSCPDPTDPPTVSPKETDLPSNSPIDTNALNDVFGTIDMTDTNQLEEQEEKEDVDGEVVEEGAVSLPPTPRPTNMVTGSKTPLGPKPSGGKKPTGGKPKPPLQKPLQKPPTLEPTSSPTLPLPTYLPSAAIKSTGHPSKDPTPIPTYLPTAISPPTEKPSEKPIDILTGLSYPQNTFFCGENWQHVNEECSIRCPSSKSEDCPEGMSCYAFTQCNDDNDLVTNDATDSSESELVGAIISEGTSAPTQATSLQAGCTGTPCPFENECRSEYGFCGLSFIYCNDLSSWTLENCGLLGVDTSGETHLCDVEVLECSNGKKVHRNPAEKCEYFECPSLEESAVVSSTFNVPGPTPLPPLPKPTLPTITESSSQSSSTFTSFGTSSSSKSDSSNSLANLLGDKLEDDREDGEEADSAEGLEEGLETSESDSTYVEPKTPAPVAVAPNYDFGSFKADVWLLNNGAHNIIYASAYTLLTTLSILQLLWFAN